MSYLVDTDVLIDAAKKTQDAIDFLDSLKASWSISTITAMELVVGARDKRELAKIDKLLKSYSAVPLNSSVGTTAYLLLKEFWKSHGLRVFDALIAATAIEGNYTLVSRNAKHFRMIPGLMLEVPVYSRQSFL